MLLAPEAAVEGRTPFTSMLFAPEVVGMDGLPDFVLGLEGRYSSLGGGLPPLSPVGDCPRDDLRPLGAGARGESWRE